MGAVTPLWSVGAAEQKRKRRRWKEEQEEERMGGWITSAGLNGMINESRLQRVLSLLWTSRDTTGSLELPHTHTLTHTHTHTLPSLLTSLTMGGTRAVIANGAEQQLLV